MSPLYLSEENILLIMDQVDTKNLPDQLVVGTDCSGIEAPIEALRQLDVKVIHKFSSDNDAHVLKSIKANYDSEVIYGDIRTRDHSKLPHVDLYVAGFPCQPFSTLGKREGFKNQIKGTIFFECLSTIEHVKPKIFILENVKGLINHDKGKTLTTILNSLENLGDYYVTWDLYNTKNYGLPQNRERIYIVGLHKNYFHRGISKPKEIKLTVSLDDLVDHNIGSNTKFGEMTAHKQDILDELLRIKKIDSLDNPWCVNLNVSSVKRTNPMRGICPCLLAGSGGGCVYYYTPLRRRFTPREYLRLQGFSDNFKQAPGVPNGQLYKQVGNSMSVPVLGFIYQEVFKHSIGWAKK